MKLSRRLLAILGSAALLGGRLRIARPGAARNRARDRARTSEGGLSCGHHWIYELKETDMATTTSTRTNGKNGRRQVAEGPQSDAVRQLITHGARIQLASVAAASKFFAGWAQSADRYVQAISNELLGRLHGETASSELVGRLATVSNEHIHDVTALPKVAVSHFNEELAKTPKPRKRPRK
jgi:hypothetical protein